MSDCLARRIASAAPSMSAKASSKGFVFSAEIRHDLCNGGDALDAAHTLPGPPDMLPGLHVAQPLGRKINLALSREHLVIEARTVQARSYEVRLDSCDCTRSNDVLHAGFHQHV